MCGISVIVGRSGDLAAEQACRLATEAVIHRGPDGMGCHQVGSAEDRSGSSSVWMGHTRLAIVDLTSGGRQPMSTPDQRYSIVYNGEVYNHRELRENLISEGVSFQSHCDTEVVLQAYVKWGALALDRFNGMFSFVIHDAQEKRLFVARDRFGIKPLYYWQMPDGGLAIGSEIKQFTVLPNWRAELSHQGAYDYVAWGFTDHTEGTLFSGVKQLLPGHRLSYDVEGGHLICQPWYRLSERKYTGTMSQAVEACHYLLREAVSLRLRADVEVGSCLSGGLDSSSIVCLVNELLGDSAVKQQKTFTAASRVAAVNERHYAEAVAHACCVEGHYCYPESDGLLSDLSDVLWHQDEPFGSTSIYAQWCVFRSAKTAGIKVMLDGQGADEQLGGYHGFFKSHCVDLLKELRWIALSRELAAIRRLHGLSSTGVGVIGQMLPRRLRGYLRRHIAGVSDGSRLVRLAGLAVEERHPFERVAGATFDAQRRLQLASASVPALLRYEDRDSMAHSIEARTPFLDHRLVEFLMSLPGEYLIKNGMTKAVLRAAMRGVLPEKIRTRVDKIGFATPEEVWMKKNARQFVQLAEESVSASQGFLDGRAVRYVADVLEGRGPFTPLIWRIICFGHWMDRFSVRHGAGVISATAISC